MIVTILWEDQGAKGFGPHTLLLSCLEDWGLGSKWDLRRHITSVPKKGNGRLLKALRRDAQRLSDGGRVFAVFDRDKTHEMWHPPAPACMAGTSVKVKDEAPGEYEIVFLDKNMESLCAAAARGLRETPPATKLTPDGRDRLLNRLASSGRGERAEMLDACPSFERLVRKVAACLGHDQRP